MPDFFLLRRRRRRLLLFPACPVFSSSVLAARLDRFSRLEYTVVHDYGLFVYSVLPDAIAQAKRLVRSSSATTNLFPPFMHRLLGVTSDK